MAYVVPTAADVKSSFPEFVDDDDAAIAPFITRASMWLDTYEWTEQDYFYGIIYLTAHYYSIYKQTLLANVTSGGGGGGASSDGPVNSFVSSIRFEDFNVRFLQDNRQKNAAINIGGQTNAKRDLLQTTVYGVLFEELRDRNIVPFAILT